MRWTRDVFEGLFWVGLSLLLGWLAYPYLPEKVPSHFNAQWQPDGWMSREMTLWFAPGILAALWVILTLCFWLASTERGKLRLTAENLSLLWGIRTLLGAFMVAVHAGILAVGLGWLPNPRPILLPSIGFLFLVIGNALPKLQPNWVAGVRLPWTLVNEQAWRAANRTAGYGFMVLGGLFVVAPLLPPIADLVLLGLLLALLAAVGIQAYVVYRRTNATTP